ncbi:hypothetical protein K1T71_004311 [Dendrolimus kikuchii]|uniref:Uncharacterized protein n=1 Tax=Dendrolimus kikuchii TaxID=765133 RepID=A0ACC1D7E4_9NEOP|nr:hypothetical protein K1T71_004311 [Dendrolimus kikuchii]
MDSQIRFSAIILESDPGFWTKTSWLQLGYGFWVDLTYVAIGLAFGFPAVSIPQLNAEDSNIILTQMEQSWIASVLSLASPVGCIFCGFLLDRFGRRFAIVSCQIPMTVGWIYIGLAKKALDIIIGRIITGVGCGMAMTGPQIYISEISLPNMRGLIGAFPGLALSIGIIMQASLGSFLEWRTLCLICSIYTIILLIADLWLPETPYFKLLKGTAENAKNSLKKFRAKGYNIDAEMEQLIEFKIDNNIRSLTLQEHFQALLMQSSCKPFSIVTMYMIILQSSGVSIVLMWTLDILQRSHSSVDAYLGNVILGVSRLITGIVVSILLFKVGRKPLALTSGLGVGIGSLMAGGYLYYTNTVTVFPMVCYVIYIISATLGYYTLPLLIMVELYPLQVRGILGGISVSFVMFLMFVTTYSYPYVRDAIGFRNTILTFGVCSLLGCIYMFFCLPETKDLTLQEIEEYYNKRRPTLTSQRKIMSIQLSRTLTRSDIYAGKSLEKQNFGDKSKKRIQGDKDLLSNKTKSEPKVTYADKDKYRDRKDDQNNEAGTSNVDKKNGTEDKDKKEKDDVKKK